MGSKKGPMETFRVVLNGGGEAPQPRGVGVVVSVEDVLGALVKADDPIKRDRWSATAVFGHPEGEPLTLWFSRTVGALLMLLESIEVGR